MSADEAAATRDKVRDLQRTLYRAAKASPARRFHQLYEIKWLTGTVKWYTATPTAVR